MKNIISFIKSFLPRKKSDSRRPMESVRCPGCHGVGLLPLTEAICPICSANIRVGGYEIEVKGTDHKQVEAVSLNLINEIANKIQLQGKSTKSKDIEELAHLSLSLSKGKFIEALENLISFCNSNNFKDYEKEAIGLLSRYNDLKQSQRTGIIGFDEFIINQNKIINTIAEILNLINKEVNTH